MSKNRNRKAPRICAAVLALFSALSLSACTEEATAPNDSPSTPVPPPLASMQLDLSFFGDGSALATGTELDGRASGAASNEALTRFHWTNAVIRVLIVNVFVDAAFTPPFTVFELALRSEPKLQSDGSYLWTYRHLEDGHEVRIDLTGRINGRTVAWELRVTDPTHEPPFDNALWFRGVSRDDGREGYWIFEDPSRGGAEYARIDWRVASDQEAELTITNLDDANEGVGDVIRYGMDVRIASLSYEDVSEDKTTSVQWDVVNGVGSLVAPDYNGGARACWDEAQQDVACDAIPPAL